MDLIETKQKADRALLISVDTGKFDAEASLNELWELCESAGAEPVLTVLQKINPDIARDFQIELKVHPQILPVLCP